jgi:hypothetical protein
LDCNYFCWLIAPSYVFIIPQRLRFPLVFDLCLGGACCCSSCGCFARGLRSVPFSVPAGATSFAAA